MTRGDTPPRSSTSARRWRHEIEPHTPHREPGIRRDDRREASRAGDRLWRRRHRPDRGGGMTVKVGAPLDLYALIRDVLDISSHPDPARVAAEVLKRISPRQ